MTQVYTALAFKANQATTFPNTEVYDILAQQRLPHTSTTDLTVGRFITRAWQPLEGVTDLHIKAAKIMLGTHVCMFVRANHLASRS